MAPKHIAKILLLAAALLFSAALAPVHAQQPPPNDAFANRIPLTGSPVEFTGTAFGATNHTSDPTNLMRIYYGNTNQLTGAPKSVNGTVWWSWTAPFDGYALLSALPSPGLTDTALYWMMAYQPAGNAPFTNTLAIMGVLPGGQTTLAVTSGATYHLVFIGHIHTNLSFTFRLEQGPVILEQPKPQTVRTGSAAYFTLLAPILGTNGNVQWQRNGVNIPGATGPTIQINNVRRADAGEYRALINTTDPSAITISDPALLTVEGADIQPQVALRYITGSTNQFMIQATGATDQYFAIQYSTNFAFNNDLLVPYWGPDKHLPLLNATEAPFEPGPADVSFLRAVHLGDLRQVCIANMCRIELAKKAWQIKFNQMSGAVVNQPELEQLFLESQPTCPLGGTITYNDLDEGVYCDIFEHITP